MPTTALPTRDLRRQWPVPSTGPDASLREIARKVRRGQRLTVDDGLALYRTRDLWTVCGLADLVRRRMHGKRAYYNLNLHLNYSNVCALACTFCSFYRTKGEPGAYEHSIDWIRAEAAKAAESGATEIHIVGGLHPWLKFDYYTGMLQAIRAVAPKVHIKAFTAVEIVHLARISNRGRQRYEGIKGVLRDLMRAGLDSLPGGGAEVFDDRVHDEAFRGKIRAGTWLDVHRAAHELGVNSNATVLYGHVETRAERVGHLEILRREQDRALREWADEHGIDRQDDDAIVLSGPDEMYRGAAARLPDPVASTAGYFQTIIPLPFIPDASALEHLPGPSGLENLRTVAVARLMLDNFPHVKAFWIMQTLPMAQFMLLNGADDIDGTVVWYDVTKAGGAGTHQEASVWDLRRAICEAGLRPVERDSLYRPVERSGNEWRVVALERDQPSGGKPLGISHEGLGTRDAFSSA
ncbi:MAG: radical SAM protein [Planctomycetota bacterium]|jgi:aminodeoxyfutalosine synthase